MYDGIFQQADSRITDNYKDALERNGITVTVRRSRGKILMLPADS